MFLDLSKCFMIFSFNASFYSGIDHLLKLETLIVDDNNILTIDTTNFERLVSLKHLSLENNLISRLKSLQVYLC